MPRTELIDQLIRDDKIIRYYDVRKRTFQDLTGGGRPALVPATFTGTPMIRNARGFSAPLNTGARFTIPDSADWTAANDGAIIFYGRWEWNGSLFMFMKAFPAFSFAWLPAVNILEMRTLEGITQRTIVGARRCLGINYYSSGIVEPGLYEDGEFAGLFSAVKNVTHGAADARWLGSTNGTSGSGYKNVAEALIITNTRLTDVEHRQVYRELADEG